MSYIHLHTHSCHSLLAGVPAPEELARTAKALGYPAVALTDIGSMAGLLLFVEACRAEGVKPILGLELREASDPARRLVLLARNAIGYGDLCEIVSRQNLHLSQAPLPELFERAYPDLFVLCPHPGLLAELAKGPLHPCLFGELLNLDKETRAVARQVEALCARLNLPLVASCDAHFLRKEGTEGHAGHLLLRAIDRNTSVDRLSASDCAPAGAWLRPAADMEALYARLPEALANTVRIADACRDDLQQQPWLLPTIRVPQGRTPESWLARKALRGLRENYAGTPEWERARDVQKKELRTIARTGYASYFLMVAQVREWASSRFGQGFRQGRQCTIMRGSAANCMTFYNLGASDLDPIRYHLYFERFLNDDRTSPPDADLDFGWDEREHALRWFSDTFGADHVAITCTTNRFRWKAAFREAAKALGYSDSQVSELMRRLRTSPTSLAGDADLARITEMSRFLHGRPRFLGQHPGGVLVTDDPIWRHVGLQRSGSSGGDTTKRIITQVDMHSGLDFLGLVKFDILGNGSLSVLRDCLLQIQEQGFRDPEMHDLERIYADPMVQAQMRSGGSRGVFYIESPAQTRLNRKAEAATFEEIGITSSLIRPAGTAWAAEFVERHRAHLRGERNWEHLHPALEPILSETHDVLVFQEDVTRICVEVAGMSFAEADKVRKMMNSLSQGEPEQYHKVADRFMSGCCERSGLSPEQARALWERVDSFRGFSFCKSHSLSYAQLSFRCAWLKAHYPAQFMAAVISNGHGFYGAPFYIDEARRMGIDLAPFDINRCRKGFYGEGNRMVPGFLHVRRMSETAVEALLAERERGGEFLDLPALVRRVPELRPAELEALAMIGAFDASIPNRAQAVTVARELSKPKRRKQTAVPELPGIGGHRLPPLPDYSFTQKCLAELSVLGYMVSGNLLDFLAVHPSAKGCIPASALADYEGKRGKVFGVPVTQRTHRTARGELMMFITLQNETGVIDCILWPEQYTRYHHIAEGSEPLELVGKVMGEQGTWSFEVERLRAVPWSPAQVDFELGKRKVEAAAGAAHRQDEEEGGEERRWSAGAQSA